MQWNRFSQSRRSSEAPQMYLLMADKMESGTESNSRNKCSSIKQYKTVFAISEKGND